LKLAKSNFKEIRAKKYEMDRLHEQKLFYEISGAAYHGGDLNGMYADRVMTMSKDIFKEIEEYLLSYQHHDRYSNKYIE
jgi:hypothetical protein